MNKRSPKCRKAVAFAIRNWNQYITTEPFHEEWIWSNASLLELKKGDKIGDILPVVSSSFYLVNGLLGRIKPNKDEEDDKKNRRSLSVICLPGNMILNTSNIHSDTLLESNIVALKHSLVLHVPHKKLIHYKVEDPVFATYINVLREKKIKQMRIHTELLQEESATARYISFTKRLPQIYRATNQKEQAEYLDISRGTIAFVRKNLL